MLIFPDILANKKRNQSKIHTGNCKKNGKNVSQKKHTQQSIKLMFNRLEISDEWKKDRSKYVIEIFYIYEKKYLRD